jgi:hypothetical protein
MVRWLISVLIRFGQGSLRAEFRVTDELEVIFIFNRRVLVLRARFNLGICVRNGRE